MGKVSSNIARCVWKSPKKSHFQFSIFGFFFTNFCPILATHSVFNPSKMSHLTSLLWQFRQIFARLKLIFLVTLFDRKFKFFKISQKLTIFWHFQPTFVHSKCKRSSLRSQCRMRLFLWFSNTVRGNAGFQR